MNTKKHVDRYRERIIKDLMPDTCQVFPLVGANTTISGSGILRSDNPVAREWRGQTDIPCRIDLSRAFRPDRLKNQATEVDEYNAEFPFDMNIEPSDQVHIVNPLTGNTAVFEVRKRKNLSEWDGTVECVISAPGVDPDAQS